jgi:ribonucleoside-diphosphate reductase alpha chain
MWQLNLTGENRNSVITEAELFALITESKQEQNLNVKKLLENLLSYLSILFSNSQNQLSEKQLIELINKLLNEENCPKTASLFQINFNNLIGIKSGEISSSQKNPNTTFSKNNLEKIQQFYFQNSSIAANLEQISQKIASLNHQDSSLKNTITKLISEKKFLPHQNLLREKNSFDQMHIILEDNLNDIFDNLKQSSINFQNHINTSIDFSKIRAKNTLIKSTHGLSAGPITFMKIYASTFEALRQNSLQDFQPEQTFIINVNHPDILEFLILVKNFSQNSTYSNFLINLNDNFIEAVLNEQEFELINPETNQPINLLSAKNTFDLIVSTILENPQLGLINSTIDKSTKSLSVFLNLASFYSKEFNFDTLKSDLDHIHKFLNFQNNKGEFHLVIYFTGIIDLLIRQNLALNSIHGLEFIENIFKELRSSLDRSIEFKIANKHWPAQLFENSIGLDSHAKLTFIKSTIDGQESLHCLDELKYLLSKNNLYTASIIEKIHEKNSLESIQEIPESIKNLIKTNQEISLELQLKLQESAEKTLSNLIEKNLYINETYDLEKLKKIILKSFKDGLKSFRNCHFKRHNISQENLFLEEDHNFLIDSKLAKKRPHREIQPPLFQIKKTEEIPLPPISHE